MPETPQKAGWEKYLFNFTKAQAFFAIILIIYLVILARITTPVPNLQIEEINGTNITTLLYTGDAYVPPTYITNNHLLFGIILVIGLILSFLTSISKKPDRADIEEARRIMNGYLKNRESIKTKTGDIIEIKNYTIDDNFITRYTEEKDEEKANRYVLQITIIDLEDITHYIKGYIHPYTRYIDGFLEIDKPLDDTDQCSHCGKEFDYKYLSTEDIKKYKELKGSLKE